MTMIAGIELGGTKAIAVLGEVTDTAPPAAPDTASASSSIPPLPAAEPRIVAQHVVPTTSAHETLAALQRVIAGWAAEHPVAALGFATFGPVRLDTQAADYGKMLATPKPGWAGADLLAPFRSLGVPIHLHTDVTAAALAEGRWGAARGLTDFIYITIGTGIGMGVIANGQPVSGALHPEAGHMRVRRVAGDTFAGACPFHGDCLEGLASGPAIAARIGRPASELASNAAEWALVADAIAESVAMLGLSIAPQRMLVGGGVGVGQPQLLPLIRAGVVEKLAGYLPFVSDATIGDYYQPAGLGDRAGPLGAIALGMG